MSTPGGRLPAGAIDLSALKQPPPAETAASGGPGVIDVTDATFERDVIARSRDTLVVVDLWATWCGPCKQLSPTLESMAAAAGGKWILAKIDVDANPGVSQAFGVQSIPTVVAIYGGQPVSAFQGVQPQAQIQQWLDQIFAKIGDPQGASADAAAADDDAVAEPEDPRLIAAANLLDEGDIDGALTQYREVLAAEPENEEAAAGVRSLEFISRASAHDPALLDITEPTTEQRLAQADLLLLTQRIPESFATLVDGVRLSTPDDKAVLRQRLLSLFEMFDAADPDVIAARRKLATALY